MPREPRTTGLRPIQHITSRGNDKQAIFRDDLDRQILLERLTVAAERYRWSVLSYCLMDNHIHLVIESAPDDLSNGCRDALGSYVRRYHRRHGTTGHLFGRRFHSVVVAREGQLPSLLRYVALNPVRAGLVTSAAEWPWSSYRATAHGDATPVLIDLPRVLTLLGRDSATARAHLRALVTMS